ncbi:MAG: cytochrome b/b6 domain-containing protein [Magnetococcales bacterium]|nr:cytochrome b/b6 domain-containing protein [Magnetococcales bacterium]
MDSTPQTIPIWDLPTRLFHWLMVALFALAWITGEMGLGWLHARCGEFMLGVLLFRLIWGFVGGETARFHNFIKGPREVLRYLQSLLSRDAAPQASVGHNPVGGVMVLALMIGSLMTIALGLFARDDDDPLFFGALAHLVPYTFAEMVAEIHEGVVGLMLVLVGLHVAANLFYLIVLRENLIQPMVTGSMPLREAPPITPPKMGSIWRAVLVASLVGSGLYFGLQSMR